MLVHAAQQAETFAFPRRHNDKHHQAETERQPATGEDFHQVGGKQRHIDTEHQYQDDGNRQLIPVPVFNRHGTGEHRGQHHGAGDGDTVGRSQIT